jgi:predicted ATPase/class 3 adenylate cyclase
MTELPTGTVTLLFTDLVGSTRLLQQLGDGYRSVIADHHRLLREAIQVHGHEVEDRGDGIFAVFARAADALAAAVTAQRTLSAHPWPACPACPGPEEPREGRRGGGMTLGVRMALHTGDPALVGGNYVGLDVHRAARLCDAGHGGQVLLSAATRELVEHHLPDGLTLRDLGEHRLRDLHHTERIYQAVIAGLPDVFPPPRTVNQRPNNLPTARVPIIGRDKEVALARDLLLRDDVGLVTLTGPGGAGKTRLGLQIATSLLDQFEDGVFLVLLAPIGDPSLVPATIARALGLRETTDRPLMHLLTDHLRGRQLLLLLDNFEQILPAALVVADLLAACPRLKILVTSRATLRLRGERELPVPPLALPGSEEPIPAERLHQYTAVALFADRAREVRADFAITTENAPAVAEICQRLDGLPLAIELAAARTRLLSPQAMLGRLGRRLPFLTGGSRDLPARQQTLRDTIGWSYDLLDPAEQQLFRRLGVFVGGFTLEAAEAVCDEVASSGGRRTSGSGVSSPLAPRYSPLDVVESLIDKSLVRQITATDNEPRFAMLETIREYALEQLEASGEIEHVRRRHAEWCAAFVEAAESEIVRDRDGRWLSLLEVEHDNIRAALAWCDSAKGEKDWLPRLANPLWMFWWQHAYWEEGRRWYDRVLELATEPAARLGALRGRGQLASQGGDLERAAVLWDEAVTLARETDDPLMLSIVLGRRAFTAALMGDGEYAQLVADESLVVARRSGDSRCMAEAFMNIGQAARARGDLEQAHLAWEECLRRTRQHGIAFVTPYVLQQLALIAIDQGDLTRAATLAEEALPLAQKRNDLWAIQGATNRLIRVAQARGDRDRTATLARENLILARTIGSITAITDHLEVLAWVARVDGSPHRAARLLGATEALRVQGGRRINAIARRALDAETVLLRQAIGEEAFEAAWNLGRALSVDQAVRYALDEIDISPERSRP